MLKAILALQQHFQEKEVTPVETGGTGMANFEVSDNSISYQLNILNAGKITSVEIQKVPLEQMVKP